MLDFSHAPMVQVPNKSNGVTLYTEKSQTFKNYLNPFLSFVLHNDWLQNHYWLSIKSMAPNFAVVVSVLLSNWLGYAIICIFVNEAVLLLGPMADKRE